LSVRCSWGTRAYGPEAAILCSLTNRIGWKATVQILNKQEVLQYIEERADFFDRCSADNCFIGSAWLIHLVTQVGTPASRFVVPEHFAKGAESTMLLFAPDGKSPLKGLGNYYSSLYSPICTQAVNRNAEFDFLIRQLRAESIVDFSPISKETAEELLFALKRNGWYAQEYFCFGNWYLKTNGTSFSQYMKERPSRLRNTWARKRKKFKGEARVEIVTHNADSAINAFQAVYSRSWKKPEPYPSFVPGWARICEKEGTLRLGVAWIGDKPIAAQIWFVENGRANIFKLAYDEEYTAWSAGTVLTAALMEHVIDVDCVKEVDYLTGDDAYKRDWMSHRRERVGVLACNPRTARGAIRAAYESVGSAVKRFTRGGRTGKRGDNPPVAGNGGSVEQVVD